MDADVQYPPPDRLMTWSPLFILAASSPKSDHRRWVKYRTDSRVFALNPPTRDELVQALALVIHSLLGLLTIFSFSRTDLLLRSAPDIISAISHYGFNMRGLRQVFPMVARQSSMKSSRGSGDFQLLDLIP